jgi:ribosomal protein L11 methyltransferase
MRAAQKISEVCLMPKNFGIGGVDVLKNVLIRQGVDERLIVESQEQPFQKISVYFANNKRARVFVKTIRMLKLKDVRLMHKRLGRRDWEVKWKEDFKPFALSRTFGVVPMRLKESYKFRGKVAVYIDTDAAFGTGLHPTTRHMARFVDSYQGRFKSFLDVGTGTGILPIIAAKCGAEKIDAVEICPDAARVARANVAANGCPRVRIRIGDAHRLKSKMKYDFVCANIITQTLMELADMLVRSVSPGKYLAVSGISANNYRNFRTCYARYPLRCLKVVQDDGWTAILYQKKNA